MWKGYSNYGLCCNHCATGILNELKERKEEGRDKKCRTDWIFNNVVYETSSGEEVSFPQMIFEVTADDGVVHSFSVSDSEYGGMTFYESREIYKKEKNGRKANKKRSTEYSFSIYGDTKDDLNLLEELVDKTASGVKYKTISAGGESGPLHAGERGIIGVASDGFIIDGMSYDSTELDGLFSCYEGFNIHYQIMDRFSPLLDKDTYLMPTKLNDKSLLDELEEIISAFSKNGSGEYIGKENVSGFEIFFKKLLGKLSFYYQCKSAGSGKIAGIKMIKRLRKIDTDDNLFPEYQIREIQDVISKGEWFNHPEKEEKENDPESN